MTIELLSRYTYDKDKGYLLKLNGNVAGTKNSAGYLVVTINSKTYLVHRLIYLLHNPDFNQKLTVDHLNGNTMDNRIENLQAKTHKNNLRNQRIRVTNKSGCMGVRKYSLTKWRTEIRINGKTKHIGMYDTFEEAVAARRKAEKLHGFHPNHGIMVA
jgi:hypothetical protein